MNEGTADHNIPRALDRAYAQSLAARYWSQGLTVEAIAKEDGLSRDTVRRVMEDWGIPRRIGRTVGGIIYGVEVAETPRPRRAGRPTTKRSR